ncbi:MAG: hypothetical protein OEZ68_21415 [Gammaproteobacteria bacterium]|nr:hypothetical protein [Gammaproteobacteria bacterium]MDH5803361.1 hypothetical protein [Gammaproteobacteria bacterium]
MRTMKISGLALSFILCFGLLILSVSSSLAVEKPVYDSMTIEGWTVYLERGLVNDARARKVLRFLQVNRLKDTQEIAHRKTDLRKFFPDFKISQIRSPLVVSY